MFHLLVANNLSQTTATTLRVRITSPSLNDALRSVGHRAMYPRLCGVDKVCCSAVRRRMSLVQRAPIEQCNSWQ